MHYFYRKHKLTKWISMRIPAIPEYVIGWGGDRIRLRCLYHYPADTRRKHNVIMASKRRRDVIIASCACWVAIFESKHGMYPPDARRSNNVIITSKRRRNVVLT